MRQRYTKNVYVHDGKPNVSITMVDVLHDSPLIVRPVSKTSGFVQYKGPTFETESAARVAAISDIDVMIAKLENLRAALVTQAHKRRVEDVVPE